MPSDIRVPLDVLFDNFGVPAIVTRPVPDHDPIATTGIWDTTVSGEAGGGDAKRRDYRRVIGLRKDQVPTVPKGTVIEAPLERGAAVQTWRYDTVDRLMDDITYVVVLPEPTI